MVRPRLIPSGSDDGENKQDDVIPSGAGRSLSGALDPVSGGDPLDENPPPARRRVEPRDDDDLDDGYRADEEDYDDEGVDGDPLDDRDDSQLAKEALRRSRRTETQLESLTGTVHEMVDLLRGGATPKVNQGAQDANSVFESYSDEDRAKINELMKTDPAAVFEVVLRDFGKQQAAVVRDVVDTRVNKSNGLDKARSAAAADIDALDNPTHPFTRKVENRYKEMRNAMTGRGVDPDAVPEIYQLAVNEVLSVSPELATKGSQDKRRLRSSSRRSRADRSSAASRGGSRGGSRDDDSLPELTEDDRARARRMNIDLSDPKEAKKMRGRKKYYNERKRG